MYFKYLRLTTGRTLTCTKRSLLCSTNYGTFSIQCKKLERRWQGLKFQISNFHTTQRLNYLPSSILYLGSICCGYLVRKWWLKQTIKQQQKYIGWFKRRKYTIYGSLGCLSFILFVYCLTHLEKDPVRKKPRLILVDQAEQIESSKTKFQIIVRNQKNVVPLHDPKYKIIATAVKRLINSNKNLFKDTDWTITIIHRIYNRIPSSPNVIILPDRSIIVTIDIFNFIKSNDLLIFILARKMSHNMLLHNSEISSFKVIYDVATIVFSFLIWVLYKSKAAITLCSTMYILFAAIFYWCKRQLETEADEVGLELAVKSCIDPREVLVFWEMMKKFEELGYQDKFRIPLFMDHPTSDKREKRIIQLMPKALELRKQAKCPKLPAKDPRDRLPYYMKDIEKHMLKIKKC